MARRTKADILRKLSVGRLRELAAAFHLTGPRRSKGELIRSFASARWLGLKETLTALTVAELTELLSDNETLVSGLRKVDLISAILGPQPARGLRVQRTTMMAKTAKIAVDESPESGEEAGNIASLDDGSLLDYISNEPVKDTPKEHVRQRIARALRISRRFCVATYSSLRRKRNSSPTNFRRPTSFSTCSTSVADR